MSWPQIVLIAWFALGALLIIANVGKQRTPGTPGAAAVSVVITAGLIWLVTIA